MLKPLPKYIRNFEVILIIILFIKIGGYFSIVETRSVNQVFKTFSRFGMTTYVLFLLSKYRKNKFLVQPEYNHILAPILYVAYLFLGLMSIGWSTDPAYSSIQWLMAFDSFIFTFLTYKLIHAYQEVTGLKINLIKVFLWAISPIALIFLIGSFALPDVFYREMRGGEEIRLGGWIMNPNELGMLTSLNCALAYIHLTIDKKRTASIIFLLISLIVLALTSSRSSAIGFLLIIGILVMQSDNKRLKVVMIGSIAIVTPLILNYIIFKDSGGVEEVMSMTGRLPFWTALLNEGIIKEPWFGYGFMRINYTDYFQGLNTYPGKMTHNTFMQVLMNLGFVGFFIAFMQLIQTIRNHFKSIGHQNNLFFLAVFIPVIINSFTEFGIFGEANFAHLFYHFLIFLYVFEPKESPSSKQLLERKIIEKKYILS